MLEFYLLPEWFRIAVSVVIAACCLCQTAALLLSCYRYRSGRAFLPENIFEGLVLLYLLAQLLLIAQVQMNIGEGFAAAPDYGAPQYILFAALTAASVPLCFLRRSPWPLVPASAAAATLPAAASVSGGAFPAVFCAALLFWLIRAVRLSLLRRREIKSEISVLSIKEAVDSLYTGLLFYRTDGSIVLINRKMEGLMLDIGGNIFQDGRRFLRLLDGGPCRPGCHREELEGNRVFRLGDGTVWLFAKNDVVVKRGPCIQLTASDVTVQWRAAEQLRARNGELIQKGEALKSTFENLQAIARQEESLMAKTRVHDVLGQRLTLLLRALREGTEPDEAVLTEFIGGLPGELGKTAAETPASSAFGLLRETMSYIGVDILSQGQPPGDEDTARLFADICTETATNAVRHGFATEVRFRFGREPEGWTLTVTDNGKGAEGPVKEGGGLRGIREKLAMAGGSLSVATSPRFTIMAAVPGGENI